MKIKILGCGGSRGVPSLTGGGKTVCNLNNPKNIRLRSSILMETDAGNILVDCGPDIRQQLIRENFPDIHAVVFTHAHYDHIVGIRDLYTSLAENGKSIPLFIPETDVTLVTDLIKILHCPGNVFQIRPIKPYIPFNFNGLEMFPIRQEHNGSPYTLGLRIGDFAYSTDIKRMEEKGIDSLVGVKTWILGVTTRILNNSHVNLDEANALIDRIKPEMTYLTHMGGTLDYEKLCAELPKYVRPAYDGMVLKVNGGGER